MKERDEIHELIDKLPENELFNFKQVILQKLFDSQVEIVKPTEEEKQAIKVALSDDEIFSFEEAFEGLD